MHLMSAHASTQEASESWVSYVAMSQKRNMGTQNDGCTKLPFWGYSPSGEVGVDEFWPNFFHFPKNLCTHCFKKWEVKLPFYLSWWPRISLAPLGDGWCGPCQNIHLSMPFCLHRNISPQERRSSTQAGCRSSVCSCPSCLHCGFQQLLWVICCTSTDGGGRIHT